MSVKGIMLEGLLGYREGLKDTTDAVKMTGENGDEGKGEGKR